MRQKVPDFDIIPDEELVCDACGREANFLIELQEPENDRRCSTCFQEVRPEYSDCIADFAVLLDLMIETQGRYMKEDTMYELYGNKGN